MNLLAYGALLEDNLDKKLGKETFEIYSKYLHGQIEELNGYDVVRAESQEAADFINHTVGIHDIKVCILNKNPLLRVHSTIYNCKAFIWRPDGSPHTKGLIVLHTDEEAIEYAMECYEEKRYLI